LLSKLKNFAYGYNSCILKVSLVEVYEVSCFHFHEIGKDSCEISLATTTWPFYKDKDGEYGVVAGQMYKWPRTYLFPFSLLRRYCWIPYLNLNSCN
jgi:hypothetical protein